MDKQAWIKEFAELLVAATGIAQVHADQCAETSYEDRDDMTPREAVESELAHWTE